MYVNTNDYYYYYQFFVCRFHDFSSFPVFALSNRLVIFFLISLLVINSDNNDNNSISIKSGNDWLDECLFICVLNRVI